MASLKKLLIGEAVVPPNTVIVGSQPVKQVKRPNGEILWGKYEIDPGLDVVDTSNGHFYNLHETLTALSEDTKNEIDLGEYDNSIDGLEDFYLGWQHFLLNVVPGQFHIRTGQDISDTDYYNRVPEAYFAAEGIHSRRSVANFEAYLVQADDGGEEVRSKYITETSSLYHGEVLTADILLRDPITTCFDSKRTATSWGSSTSSLTFSTVDKDFNLPDPHHWYSWSSITPKYGTMSISAATANMLDLNDQDEQSAWSPHRTTSVSQVLRRDLFNELLYYNGERDTNWVVNGTTLYYGDVIRTRFYQDDPYKLPKGNKTYTWTLSGTPSYIKQTLINGNIIYGYPGYLDNPSAPIKWNCDPNYPIYFDTSPKFTSRTLLANNIASELGVSTSDVVVQAGQDGFTGYDINASAVAHPILTDSELQSIRCRFYCSNNTTRVVGVPSFDTNMTSTSGKIVRRSTEFNFLEHSNPTAEIPNITNTEKYLWSPAVGPTRWIDIAQKYYTKSPQYISGKMKTVVFPNTNPDVCYLTYRYNNKLYKADLKNGGVVTPIEDIGLTITNQPTEITFVEQISNTTGKVSGRYYSAPETQILVSAPLDQFCKYRANVRFGIWSDDSYTLIENYTIENESTTFLSEGVTVELTFYEDYDLYPGHNGQLYTSSNVGEVEVELEIDIDGLVFSRSYLWDVSLNSISEMS